MAVGQGGDAQRNQDDGDIAGQHGEGAHKAEFLGHRGKDEVRMSNFSPMVLINPIISGTSGTMTYEEGCLSVPGVYEEVKRFKSIHVKYQNIKGEFLELEADDLLSICIQHENDHLDGIIFIERLSNLKKNFYKKKILKDKKK
jgi:peptide deformylase